MAEFNLSEKIINSNKQNIENCHLILVNDIKEFIRRRIERTKLICRLYSHKQGNELAGELNEDLMKDIGEKLA